MTAMTTEESVKIGSRNLSVILAPIDFPAIATAPMPFVLNSMRSLTNCWFSFVFMPFAKHDLAHARLETLRLKLFKVGAQFLAHRSPLLVSSLLKLARTRSVRGGVEKT